MVHALEVIGVECRKFDNHVLIQRPTGRCIPQYKATEIYMVFERLAYAK